MTRLTALIALAVLEACGKSSPPTAAPPPTTIVTTEVPDAQKPVVDAAPTAPAIEQPTPIVSTAVPGGVRKPAPPVVGDPCPLDNEDASSGEWRSCVEVGPFHDHLAVLGAGGARPCRQVMTRNGKLGVTTTYSYDAAGHVLGAEEVASGDVPRKETWTYDAKGRIVGYDSLGKSHLTWRYSYDTAGRVARIDYDEDPGYFSTFTRDPAGVITQSVYHRDEGDVTTTYTANGFTQIAENRDEHTTTKTTVALERDAKGRRSREVRDDSLGHHVVTYRYDAAGRLVGHDTHLTEENEEPFDEKETIRYDAAGVPIESVTVAGSETWKRVWQYECR